MEIISPTKSQLYFLPGTMCDQRIWQAVWPFLQKLMPQLTCVHLPIPSTINFGQLIDELTNQLPQTANVLGFSLGGYLASALAVSSPSKVGHLMVVSNLPSALPEREIKHRQRTIKWIEQHGYSGISKQRMFDLLHRSAHKNQNILSTIVDMDKSLGQAILLQQLKVSSKRENLLASLVALNIPINFISGNADVLVDIDRIKQVSNHANKLSVDIIENCGHMLPLEHPEILAKLITKKLTDCAI